VRFQGAAYRAHNPRWSWDPLSGEGARSHGGRFNAKGVPALYLSCDWATAVLEGSQGFAFRFPPLTIVTYDVDCDRIVDLSTTVGLRTNKVAHRDPACAWKLLAEKGEAVPSWQAADRLRKQGAAGVLVPSFAANAGARSKNLVLWRWGPALPYKVTIFDPEGRLPRDNSSWRS
jgi:RES domain-containing protein